jgi:hypothetical protein
VREKGIEPSSLTWKANILSRCTTPALIFEPQIGLEPTSQAFMS